ncbi:ABC-2 transporter permease [Cohnella nanjingensis]|uniref:ABC-2 transporter permease n=1 Tax=Cohnella nanjingensis TaxID=1387779 RepID=A0A7X0VHB8_9BACL|nr:ABC-2 transporter permease [Cohnella nanjingensis]MBB6674002.1 ABC-2 transporter permease [Cohnella nanjingensis]
MLNLVRKDLLILRYLYLFVVGYALFMGFMNVRTVFTTGLLAPLMLLAMVATIETRNRAMAFVGSLPVRRRDIVAAKYATVLIFVAIGVLLSCAARWMYGEMFRLESTGSYGSDAWIVTLVGLLFGSVYCPLYYGLGHKGLYLVNFLSLATIFAASAIMFRFLDDAALAQTGPAAILLSLAAAAALLLASYLLSLRIVRRKDLHY